MNALPSLALGALLVGMPPVFRREDPQVAEFADLGLKLTFPAAFTDLVQSPPGSDKQIRGSWNAKLGEAELRIDLIALPIGKSFRFAEPDDVTDIILVNLRRPGRGDPGFWFEETELVSGKFGWASYGSIGRGTLHDEKQENALATIFVLGGLLPEHGYALEVTAPADLGQEPTLAVLEFLRKGVQYAGKVRDPKWTEAEVRERWERDAPPATHKKLEKTIRTPHYVILTNSSGGKAFAKAMEECYATIRKTYPFEDSAEQRLMPVFLFQTPDEYYDYYAKIADIQVESARRSKGHAWRDYYATWYEAPNDPVHIHEGTHQIFANRLHLNGGGSWFQEGVAEYMETSKNDRNAIATQVKKSRYKPLVEFVALESLLHSSKADDPQGDAAGDHYKQAALLIEFLRESKTQKAKFPDFLRIVGRVPRSNVPAIQKAVKGIYGVDLAGLEVQWVEYCKKR